MHAYQGVWTNRWLVKQFKPSFHESRMNLMKAKNTKMTLTGLIAVSLLVFLASGCASSASRTGVRVTEERRYIQLSHLRDSSQAGQPKQGEKLAMACKKCKTVQSYTPSSGYFRFPSRQGIAGDAGRQQRGWALQNSTPRHYCPGCRSVVTTTGTGKDQNTVVQHSCAKCGDLSISCCATTPESTPTPGMENSVM